MQYSRNSNTQKASALHVIPPAVKITNNVVLGENDFVPTGLLEEKYFLSNASPENPLHARKSKACVNSDKGVILIAEGKDNFNNSFKMSSLDNNANRDSMSILECGSQLIQIRKSMFNFMH